MNTTEQTLDTLVAMRRQEELYLTADYLHQSQHDSTINNRNTPAQPLHQTGIDVECRDKMCEWCYQVVKFCNFSRESVEIAMNYLDRFLLTEQGAAALQDRNVYQLASMTALYTAIKINERQAMNPAIVSTLSQNTYSPQDVEKMEALILSALEWRMNPPTSASFVRELLNLLPDEIIKDRETAIEIAKYQTELAVADYRFIATPASTIAYCAIMNSIECMGITATDNDNDDDDVLAHIRFILTKSIGLDLSTNDDQVVDAQSCLFAAIETKSFAMDMTKKPQTGVPDHDKHRRTSFAESPRRVSEKLCT